MVDLFGKDKKNQAYLVKSNNWSSVVTDLLFELWLILINRKIFDL